MPTIFSLNLTVEKLAKVNAFFYLFSIFGTLDSVSGEASDEENPDKINEILVPNEFDCRFYEPPNSDKPTVRVVADTANRRCIFAATSTSNVKRGYFSSLSQCVSICFGEFIVQYI